MARPAPVLDSFIWGANGEAMTPEQIARQREIAAALGQQGIDTSPVASWTQGAARVANALAGVVKERRANSAESANTAANSSILQSLLGGGAGGFPAAPPVGASGGGASIQQSASAQATPATGAPVDLSGATGNMSAFTNSMYQAGLSAGLNDTQARLMAAQAAHESGNGAHAPGNNFFGIKAGKSWDGDTQSLMTHEEVNGRNVPMRQTFRKYSDAGQAIKDRIAFMQRNFPDAFNAPDINGAIGGLQHGRFGSYATDSNYAQKLQPYLAAIQAGGKPAVAAVNSLAQGEPIQVASLDPTVGMAPDSLATMAPGTVSPAYDPSGLPPLDPNDPMAPVPQPSALGPYTTVKPASSDAPPVAGDASGATPSGQAFLSRMTSPKPIGGVVQALTAAPQAAQATGKPQGAGTPGEIRQGADGKNYQYAQTTGMAGATGDSGWIETSMAPQGGQQAAQAQDLSQIPVEAGGTLGALPPGQAQRGINPAIIEALSNPAASEQTRKIAGMLLGQQMQAQQQENDPLRQLQIQAAQKSLAVPPKQWQKLDDHTLFDPVSGETKAIGGGGPTRFEGTGLDAQAWNILQTADPNSREYATAYSIVSQPKTQLVQTENGMMPVEVPPQLPAWLAPPGGSAPVAPTAAPPGTAPAAAAPSPSAVQPSAAGAAGAAIPGTKKPATEAQLRNQQLYSVVAPEVKIVDDNFNALTELGNQAGGSIPFAGNYFTSSEYQRATNSINSIIASYLYSVSGATASPQEVEKLAGGLVPKPGESVGSIADKRARLKTYVDAIRIASGQPAQPRQDAPDGEKKRLKFNPATGELE